MSESENSIVCIDENETPPKSDEVIDVDKEYEAEEGEIVELSTNSILSTNEVNVDSSVQCLMSSPEPEKEAFDISVQCLTNSPGWEPEKSAPPVLLPTFEVQFRNKADHEKLGDAVLKALKNSEILGEPKFEYVTSDGIIQAFATETCRADVIENKITNTDENSNDSTDFGDDLNKLFTIDSTPSTKLQISEVPSYKRNSRDVLDIEVKPKQKKVDENACARPRPSMSCFNCGDYNHSIRDCPNPRNQQRIARAKRARASKAERYHVDVDQRFAHLRPGEISQRLRKALSLRRNELPGFFFRMRTCGYPPGWLEEAKVSHSGLTMFNTGEDVRKSEENGESNNECEIKYDISKIIEFPGFNIMPEGFHDDYKFYNVPPYNKEYSKAEMIAALGDTAIKGFKRKKLKDHTEEGAIEKQDATVLDLNVQDEDQHEEMEIDDNIVEGNIEFIRPMPPPLPPSAESEPPMPPLPPAETNENSELVDDSIAPPASTTAESDDPTRSNSPTLEELEVKQRELLELTNGLENEESNADMVTTSTSTSSPTKNKNDLQYIIKTSHIGTPVLQFSPFDKIPTTDKFKVGVSDVINFENLPDSTGKYEAMKEIISKVRLAKKRLAEEDD